MRENDNSPPKVDFSTNQTRVNNEHTSGTVSSRNIDSFSSKVSKGQVPIPVNSREGRSGQGKLSLGTLNLGSSMQKEDLTRAPEKPPSKSDGRSSNEKRETIESLSRERTSYGLNTPKKTEENSMQPTFLSTTYIPSSIKDEQEQLEVGEQVNHPVREDAKPPPLAGANVMNVVLVAAECAPWRKTGFYFP